MFAHSPVRTAVSQVAPSRMPASNQLQTLVRIRPTSHSSDIHQTDADVENPRQCAAAAVQLPTASAEQSRSRYGLACKMLNEKQAIHAVRCSFRVFEKPPNTTQNTQWLIDLRAAQSQLGDPVPEHAQSLSKIDTSSF
jgi:hypothetical protein